MISAFKTVVGAISVVHWKVAHLARPVASTEAPFIAPVTFKVPAIIEPQVIVPAPTFKEVPVIIPPLIDPVALRVSAVIFPEEVMLYYQHLLRTQAWQPRQYSTNRHQ